MTVSSNTLQRVQEEGAEESNCPKTNCVISKSALRNSPCAHSLSPITSLETTIKHSYCPDAKHAHYSVLQPLDVSSALSTYMQKAKHLLLGRKQFYAAFKCIYRSLG